MAGSLQRLVAGPSRQQTGGDLDIQGTLSANKIVSRGDGTFHGQVRASGFDTLSDKRKKKAIQKFTEGKWQRILRLEGVFFQYVDDLRRKNVAGFLAQQVKKHIPEAVTTDEDGWLLIDMCQMLPHLVEAVKEIHGTIQDQVSWNYLEDN